MDRSNHYCPHCGRSVLATWKYCPGCAGLLPSADSVRAGDPQGEQSIGPTGDRRLDEALLRLREGDLDSAGDCIQQVLRESPGRAEAHALWGTISLRRYKVQEANQHLEEAVRLAPSSPFVRLKVAEYWVALGVPARAMEELVIAESSAANDLPLFHQIRLFSRDLRNKTSGTLPRQAPALPKLAIREWIGRTRSKLGGQSST